MSTMTDIVEKTDTCSETEKNMPDASESPDGVEQVPSTLSGVNDNETEENGECHETQDPISEVNNVAKEDCQIQNMPNESQNDTQNVPSTLSEVNDNVTQENGGCHEMQNPISEVNNVTEEERQAQNMPNESLEGSQNDCSSCASNHRPIPTNNSVTTKTLIGKCNHPARMEKLATRMESKKRKGGRWCSVPQCKYKRGNTLHAFPTNNADLKKKWIILCRMGKAITPNMYVCSDHFCKEDYIPKINSKKRRLKNIAYPTQNLPRRSLDKVPTPSEKQKIIDRANRLHKRVASKNAINVQYSAVHSCNSVSFEMGPSLQEKSVDKELKTESCSDSAETDLINIHCKSKNAECSMPDTKSDTRVITGIEATIELQEKLRGNISCNDSRSKRMCCETLIQEAKFMYTSNKQWEEMNLLTLIKTDMALKNVAGIDFKMLQILTKDIEMCEEEHHQYGLNPQEIIVMTLCKLKLNLSFESLAILFNIKRDTCRFIFGLSIHLLVHILKSALYWPSKDEIVARMPKCFKTFNKTCVVLHSIEIPVETPKCETIKLLLGLAPNGSITYCSKPYGGRVPDKSIFIESGILKRLTPMRDAIMVDMGFPIETECAEAGIDVIVPPNCEQKKQMHPNDVKTTLNIVSARLYVQYAIQRMKSFSILTSKISLSIVPYMEEISTIVCGLVNLSDPSNLSKFRV